MTSVNSATLAFTAGFLRHCGFSPPRMIGVKTNVGSAAALSAKYFLHMRSTILTASVTSTQKAQKCRYLQAQPRHHRPSKSKSKQRVRHHQPPHLTRGTPHILARDPCSAITSRSTHKFKSHTDGFFHHGNPSKSSDPTQLGFLGCPSATSPSNAVVSLSRPSLHPSASAVGLPESPRGAVPARPLLPTADTMVGRVPSRGPEPPPNTSLRTR